MCLGVGLPLACHIGLFLGANSKNIVEYYLNTRKTVSFRSPKTGAGKKVTFGVLLHRWGGAGHRFRAKSFKIRLFSPSLIGLNQG